MSNVLKLSKAPKGVKFGVYEDFESKAEVEKRLKQEEEERKKIEEERLAREQRERELKETYEKGFEAGYSAAIKDMQKEFERELALRAEQFSKIIEQLSLQINELDNSFDKVISEVSIYFAEKILRREIDRSSPIIENLKAAIRKVLGANEIIVKINPNDYELLSGKVPVVFQGDEFGKIRFEPDSRIEKGGVLLQSDIGNVDAKIETQIEELKKAFERYKENDWRK